MSRVAPTPRRVEAPPYPTFPPSEFEDRQRRVRAAMTHAGIDLLLLASRENIVYLTGYSSVAWITKGIPAAVVLFHRDVSAPTMILPDFWFGTAEKTTFLDDFVLHRNSHSDPDDFARLVVEVIESRGWGGATIGLEMGLEMLLSMPLRQFDAIRAGLPGARWEDAGPAIWSARMIKSPGEVDALRRSAQRANGAQEHLHRHAVRGQNELSLAAELKRELLSDASSEQDRIFLNIRGGGVRFNMTDTYPKDRPVGDGEILIMDAGIYLEGYASDTARCMVFGEPTKEQRDIYHDVIEALDAGIAAARPGAPASDVFHAVRGVYAGRGYPVHIDMVGHGIGLDVHEPPMLSPINDTPLEEGMVLCIEPWLTLPDIQTVFTIEDTFHVGPNGAEQLSLRNADRLWAVGD